VGHELSFFTPFYNPVEHFGSTAWDLLALMNGTVFVVVIEPLVV